MMNRAGVDCRTISGTSEEGKGLHTWNIIKINGEWKHVDVTWNLTRSCGKVGIPYGNGNDEDINANGRRNFSLPEEIAEGIRVY